MNIALALLDCRIASTKSEGKSLHEISIIFPKINKEKKNWGEEKNQILKRPVLIFLWFLRLRLGGGGGGRGVGGGGVELVEIRSCWHSATWRVGPAITDWRVGEVSGVEMAMWIKREREWRRRSNGHFYFILLVFFFPSNFYSSYQPSPALPERYRLQLIGEFLRSTPLS